MQKQLTLPDLSRVVAGSKATLELPIGPTYYRINFQATGTALAVSHINGIRVAINGKYVQTFTNLQRLFDINTFHGRVADTVNDFCLHFFSADMAEQWQRIPGIGTQGLATVHIELDIDATAPVDLAIKAYAQVDPQPQALGAFFQIREYPTSAAVAGELELDKLPRKPFYAVIHAFKPDVSKVEILTDNTLVVQATKPVLERFQKEAAPVPRVPITASATHIDFTALAGELNYDVLATNQVSDFRLKFTLDTAGALDVVTETLDVLS